MTSITHIARALPDREVTNADLARRNPDWNMARVVERAGVESRRVVGIGETAYDLGLKACAALVEESGCSLDGVDAVLSCAHAPDYIIPGNAHLLHRELGLPDDVLAFDYTLTCSGFVYGLAFADAFTRTGLASDVLLVTAETMSKRINPRDRASSTLFGDGAAATRLSGRDGGGGRIVATKLCSHGGAFDSIYVPGGGARHPSSDHTRREETGWDGNVRALDDLYMDGRAVWSFVTSTVPGHVRSFLSEHGVGLDDVDVFVFHQASKLVLDTLSKALDIEDRLYVRMTATGNLMSASIPVALKAALADGTIRSGHTVLLTAYGGGLSYGSVLLEF